MKRVFFVLNDSRFKRLLFPFSFIFIHSHVVHKKKRQWHGIGKEKSDRKGKKTSLFKEEWKIIKSEKQKLIFTCVASKTKFLLSFSEVFFNSRNKNNR